MRDSIRVFISLALISLFGISALSAVLLKVEAIVNYR